MVIFHSYVKLPEGTIQFRKTVLLNVAFPFLMTWIEPKGSGLACRICLAAARGLCPHGRLSRPFHTIQQGYNKELCRYTRYIPLDNFGSKLVRFETDGKQEKH
jgi:hypothetical protein